MTQLERDELVERYLAGEMSPREVEEFQARSATDTELQQTLKAQEMVRAIILNDIEDVPEQASYHAALMGLLAATPAAVGTTVGGAATSAGAASTAGTVAGMGAAKVAIGLLLAGTLTLGTVMVLNVKKESGVAPALPPRTPQVQQTPSFAPAQPPTLDRSAENATIKSVPTNVAPRESSNAARVQQNERINKVQEGKQSMQKSNGRTPNSGIQAAPETQGGDAPVDVQRATAP